MNRESKATSQSRDKRSRVLYGLRRQYQNYFIISFIVLSALLGKKQRVVTTGNTQLTIPDWKVGEGQTISIDKILINK